MTFTPATSACTSPTALSGVRLLPSMMRSTSPRGLALVIQVDGREHESLSERVGRERGEPTGGNASHIGDVDECAGEELHTTGGEHGPEHEDVVRMDPAAVGVIHCEHVTGTHRGEGHVLDERGE